MNVSEPQNYSNSDIQSVARFVEILMQAEQRVSRCKPTSAEQGSALGRGLLDKLEISLPVAMSVVKLRERCKELGYRIKGEYKGHRKFYLSIYDCPQPIDCFLGNERNEYFSKVILNPSKVEKYSTTESELLKIFGPTVLNSKIYRLDFTVDIYEDYSKVLSGLDIKYKKANSEFLGDSVRTGLNVGVKNDKVIIYDKGLKEKVKKTWTRIERQMSGKKIFIKSLGELKSKLNEIIKFDPLGIINLKNIQTIENVKYTALQLEKLSDLKALLKYEGYFLAKKKLSVNNNFQRDYGDFLVAIPYDIQPSEIFNRDIANFFKES